MSHQQKNRPNTSGSLLYGKVPPQVIDFEEAVLGACMLEKDTFNTVLEIIPHKEVFYLDAHMKIYGAMLALMKSGSPVDLLTITDQLRKTNDLETVGGAYALTRLTMSVMSSANVEVHSRIVYEKYLQREAIRISGSIMSDAYEDSTDVFDLLDRAQKDFQIIADIPGAKRTTTIARSAAKLLEELYEHRSQPGDITGISTGFPTMDKKMYGWQKSNLIILAARPSVGKTAFAINLAFNATWTPYKKVGVIFFSMEMMHTRVSKRALAFTSKIGLTLLNTPKELTEIDLQHLQNGIKELAKYNIFIDDTASLSALDLRNKSKKIMRENPEITDWVIIADYLQLIRSEVKGNSVEQLTQISRDFKKIPMELNCPLIALSQLNRDKSPTDIPTLSDLRGSGSIEQDADDVLFLSNPSKEMVDKNPFYKDKILVTGAKFRDGRLFELALSYDKELQFFAEPAREFKSGASKPPSGYQQQPRNFYEPQKDQTPDAKDDIPF